MALSLALHGLAVLLLFAAGASGSASLNEQALLVEVAFTAAATIDAAEQAAEVMAPESEQTEPAKPSPQLERVLQAMPSEQPPAVDLSHLKPIELAPPEEPPPPDLSALKPIELLAAQEPPPVKPAELKPAEPAKPAPPPKIEQARPAPKPAAPKVQAKSNLGSASDAQSAASGFLPAPIVFEGRPRFRHPPKPAVYPPRAIELDQQGEVLVRVRLDTAGTAVEIVLHRSCGHQLLDRAALAAVREWHFHPAVRDGRAVAAWVEIPVRFHLR